MRRRKWSNFNFDAPEKVVVLISWDNVTNSAYKLNFSNIKNHFNKVQLTIDYIKASIPSSQREYDPETKSWFIGESSIQNIRDFCSHIPDFEIIFNEKPDQLVSSKITDPKADYAEFKRMLSFAHIDFEDTKSYSIAKRAYLRAAMKLHPDVAPAMYQEMQTLNEVWARLNSEEVKYFEKGA